MYNINCTWTWWWWWKCWQLGWALHQYWTWTWRWCSRYWQIRCTTERWCTEKIEDDDDVQDGKFRWALQQDRLYFNNKIFVFNATTQQVFELIFQLFVNCLSKSLKFLSYSNFQVQITAVINWAPKVYPSLPSRQACSSHHQIVIWICFWFCIWQTRPKYIHPIPKIYPIPKWPLSTELWTDSCFL